MKMLRPSTTNTKPTAMPVRSCSGCRRTANWKNAMTRRSGARSRSVSTSRPVAARIVTIMREVHLRRRMFNVGPCAWAVARSIGPIPSNLEAFGRARFVMDQPERANAAPCRRRKDRAAAFYRPLRAGGLGLAVSSAYKMQRKWPPGIMPGEFDCGTPFQRGHISRHCASSKRPRRRTEQTSVRWTLGRSGRLKPMAEDEGGGRVRSAKIGARLPRLARNRASPRGGRRGPISHGSDRTRHGGRAHGNVADAGCDVQLSTRLTRFVLAILSQSLNKSATRGTFRVPRPDHAQKNACSPVCARPRISAWTSCAPS